MKDSSTGGPAFPSTEYRRNDAFPSSPTPHSVQGMTLRDYFAAKAMQAIRSNAQYLDELHEGAQLQGISTHAVIAGVAYRQADAMLKARNA